MNAYQINYSILETRVDGELTTTNRYYRSMGVVANNMNNALSKCGIFEDSCVRIEGITLSQFDVVV